MDDPAPLAAPAPAPGPPALADQATPGPSAARSRTQGPVTRLVVPYCPQAINQMDSAYLPQTWWCVLCCHDDNNPTNRWSRLACRICGSPRPSHAAAVRWRMKSWVCVHCLLPNQGQSIECYSCDQLRPPPPAAHSTETRSIALGTFPGRLAWQPPDAPLRLPTPSQR